MRKILEAFALAAVVWLVYLAIAAFYGPARLPSRIPTHFGVNGRPDAWGPAAALLFFPVVGLTLYLLITLVARHPSVFNYPVRVTPINRPRLEALALDMIAWLKFELAWLFAGLEWFALHAARHPGAGIPVALMPVALVCIFSVIAWYVAAMFRASHATTRPQKSAKNGK
jgi:uncharacterized membrane protein